MNVALRSLVCLSVSSFVFFSEASYGALNQPVNDVFFMNPAALSMTKKFQLKVGDIYADAKINFEGTHLNPSGTSSFGSASSHPHINIPYATMNYRVKDNLVLGLNAVPRTATIIEYNPASFINTSAIATYIETYDISPRFSYQLTKSLAIGLGWDIITSEVDSRNRVYLSSEIPGIGQLVLPARGTSFNNFDVGLFYTINPTNFLSLAYFSPNTSTGYGVSTAGTLISQNYHAVLKDAPVAMAELIQIIGQKLIMTEALYWSGWHRLNVVTFEDTAVGTFKTPFYEKDTYSLLVSGRYALNEKWGILGAIGFDSDPTRSPELNYVSFPTGAYGYATAGLDLAIEKDLSVQLLATYGGYIPKSSIGTSNDQGTASLAVNLLTLQFTYKV